MNNQNGFIIRVFFILIIAGTAMVSSFIWLAYWNFSRDLPKIVTAEDYRPPIATRILGDGGREESLVGEFFKERRYLVPYDKIPDIVIKAFISAEDDQFFSHQGVNILSIIRAGVANFKAGHIVQGGSTITQQVAKSLVLSPEKSLARKIKEVIIAYRIEKNLTKQQILYLYLNQNYFGHGAYGVQAAAKTYFAKDISEVTLAEAALLAGLPQAPGKYSPLLNPKKAKERQLYVLRRMRENNFITAEESAHAASQEVKIFHDSNINEKYSAYLVEHIRKYLAEKYGERAIYEDGLTVSIPASPHLLVSAARSLRSGLESVDKRIGYRGPIKKLDSLNKIEEFKLESRKNIIERKIAYVMLMPDGNIDLLAAMRASGLISDLALIDIGEIYDAVVIGVNDIREQATVSIGSVICEIPMKNLLWAKPLREENQLKQKRVAPQKPSDVLAKGDVVLSKVISKNSEKCLEASLEQRPEVQGALLSMDVVNGQIIAMEGGYDFKSSEFNRAIQAQRQPGSAFKPIIYSAALENGYTPASIIVDSPIVYEDSESGKWKPSNFEERFYGDTTFRQALIKSRNVPTIKIVQSMHVSSIIDYVSRLVIDGKFPVDLSISLGSASISLFELTKAYALFPRKGRAVSPIFITKIIDRDGRVLEEKKTTNKNLHKMVMPMPLPSPSMSVQESAIFSELKKYPLPDEPEQVMDQRVAFVMTHLMKEVVTYGTGHEAKNLGKISAGKTGTTNEYIDAWYIGFTPSLVTGVWVGFDNQKSIGTGETGAKAALPIWLNFMKDAVKAYPDEDFMVPPGVVFVSIDTSTGKLVPPNFTNAIKEAFIEGTEPTESSDKPSDNPHEEEFFKENL